MNIYYVGWVQDEQFSLGAVVIAQSEFDAIAEVSLDTKYDSEITVSMIGVCTDGTSTTQTVCRQSL